MIKISKNSGRITLTMTAQRMGGDLSVSLFGGDAPHIGAAALAEPRGSLSGDGSISASCSVISVCGHKDDELARNIALMLAARLECRVCLACGVHVDGITRVEIEDVLVLSRNMAEELLTKL